MINLTNTQKEEIQREYENITDFCNGLDNLLKKYNLTIDQLLEIVKL